MADKKKYYKLDDVGFLGVQEKGSQAQKAGEFEKTAAFIAKAKKRRHFSVREEKSFIAITLWS